MRVTESGRKKIKKKVFFDGRIKNERK